MKILTKAITTKLIKNRDVNNALMGTDDEKDFKPVVKLFGGGACTWLLTELDPESNVAFGLCDLGHGTPEMGSVCMDELLSIKFPPFGLPIERDRNWIANKTLSEYADEARKHGRIAA